MSLARECALATVLALALLPGAAFAQQAAPAVTVVKVEPRDITPSTSFTGRIEAMDKVDLRARVDGFLEQRLFTEGQDVKAGDLLFVIEKAPYQAEIENVDAAIARAQATLDLAEIERRRQAELVKKQATAQARLDEATGRSGEAKADLRRQQAALTTAELNLGYTDIKAPIAGRIGRSNFSVGNFVGPQSGTLATIVSQDPMYVTFPVTQRQLLAVRKEGAAGGNDPKNMAVKVQLADGSLYGEVGRLNFVDVQVNQGTDTVPGPGHAAESRWRAGRRPAGHRGGRDRQAAGLPGDPAAGGADRPGWPVRAQGRRREQGAGAADHGRYRARRLLCRDQRPDRGRARHHRGPAEGAAGHGGRCGRGPGGTRFGLNIPVGNPVCHGIVT